MPEGYMGPAQVTGLVQNGEARFDFTNPSIRRSSIRKVYSILMCQLLVNLAVIALFVFHEPTRVWAHHQIWLFWVSFALTFLSLTAIACCGNVRRHWPTNVIYFSVFAAAESLMLGFVSGIYQVVAVMVAVGITAALCLAVLLFSLQTKWDFNMTSGALLCVVVVLIMFGITSTFLAPNRMLTLVYASAGALLFCLYLVLDTHLMMSPKHACSILYFYLHLSGNNSPH